MTQGKAETFQDILKRERTQRGWSQSDVATRIGSDPKTVGRWERGLTFPSPYLSQRLSEIYGKTVQELGLVRDSKEAFSDNVRSTKYITTDDTRMEYDSTGIKANQSGAEPAFVSSAIDTKHAQIDTIKEENDPTYRKADQISAEPTLVSSTIEWRVRTLSRLWTRIKVKRPFLFLSLFVIVILMVALGSWSPLLKALLPSSIQTATPLPGNPYTGKGTLTVNDSLGADTAAAWSLSNTDEGQCFFADGAYRIKGIKAGGYMKLCLAAETYFSNFTYEVKMQVVKGDCGGLAFRSTFPQLYYFLICQDGNYRFVRFDRDHYQNKRIVVSGVSTTIHHGLGNTNIVAVVADGENFTLWVNHIRMYQGTDGAYLDGQIGLLAHTCSIVYLDSRPDVCAVPVVVAFSDARVWKI